MGFAALSPTYDVTRSFRLGVGGDLHLDDLVGVADAAVARLVALLDLVDVLHSGLDLAPDRVLAVKERGWREADEELAVGAVRVLGAGHRQGAAHVLLVREFGLQLGAGAAGAGAGRVAGLRHETVDDAVERHAVVEAAPGQRL